MYKLLADTFPPKYCSFNNIWSKAIYNLVSKLGCTIPHALKVNKQFSLKKHTTGYAVYTEVSLFYKPNMF